MAVSDSPPDSNAVTGLLARGPDLWEVRTTTDGDPTEVVDALVSHVIEAGGGPVNWFRPAATDADARAATRAGLAPTRRVWQMRCSLPMRERASVSVRAYEPGRDRAAWVLVNNRAFEWHPDQSDWTEDDVRQREREPWFDPAGFLLHEVEGRLAAFCWTKVHHEHEPPLGEIYVIAVDPDFQGRGLGRELTLTGLGHLADRGLEIGMLYVEDDNDAAIGVYRRLGFSTHHEDVFFTGTVS